jgi:putative ABC transport system permease protein
MPNFRAEVERRLGELDTDPASRAEIVEELTQHLGDYYETALSRGLDAAAARSAALQQLDDGHLAAGIAASAARAVDPAPALAAESGADAPRGRFGGVWVDLRHAARALRKSPGYSLLAILTLALGLGATTSIFAIVDAVMLRQLPYAGSDRLVRVFENNLERGWTAFSFSQPNFIDYARRTRAFDRFAAMSDQSLTLTGHGDADVVTASNVSHDFLSTLGVAPILGRDFTAAEDTPGGDSRVVLLSHAFWQSALGGDRDALDRSLILDGTAHRVIGVLPQEFDWGDSAVLRPLAADPAADRGDHRIGVIGRLAAGQTLDSARAEMESIALGLGESYPKTNAGWGITLMSFYDWLIPVETRDALLILAGAVSLLLLVACGNVANLMLARTNARRRELAVRAALGARRGRIVRYLLSESVLLSFGGATLGLGMAALAIAWLSQAAADALPRADEIALGWPAVLFAYGVAFGCGIAFGSVTAVRASRGNLNLALRDASQGRGVEARRLRDALILLQMAVSVALLIGGGLLLRSFWKLQAVDPGFDTASLVVGSITVPAGAYDGPDARIGFYERLLERVRALPGVGGSALSSIVPFGSGNTSGDVRVPGWDGSKDAGLQPASWRLVSPGYFAALGIPLRGRDFDTRDRAGGNKAVIINEALAQLFWPDGNAVGRTIAVSSFGGEEPIEIVGVAGDVRSFGLDQEPGAMVFASTMFAPHWNPLQVVVRTEIDAAVQVTQLRDAMRDVDPNVPFFEISTIDERLSATLAPRRLNLCIRLALGASSGRLFALVVGHGMRLALAGAVLGVLAALVLSRSMESMLFSVSARDPATFIAVPLVLLAVAFAACSLPALRAARVDPNHVLRSE